LGNLPCCNAAVLGFDLTGVSVLDLSPGPEIFAGVETKDIFTPGEVEREPVTRKIIEYIDRVKPQRIFLDALTQFRYLAPDSFQFHKQALSFLKCMVQRGATVLFTSEHSQLTPDDDMQFLSDGVLHLENNGGGQRSVCVTKFRGSDFKGGRHSLKLTDRGWISSCMAASSAAPRQSSPDPRASHGRSPICERSGPAWGTLRDLPV